MLKNKSSLLLTALTLNLCMSGLASADVESIPAGEADAIVTIGKLIDTMVRDQTARDGVAHRDAHAKHHGCVRASFEVLGGLDAKLAVGPFSQPRTYPAWIRFSNGSGKSQDDSEGDGRGMAVKIMGVEGDKIMEDEKDAKTQDFVMINNPSFFVRNAVDYIDFQRGITEGNVLKFFFPGLNPLNWRAHELKIANALKGKKVASPLDTPYWSMTPYSLGSSQMKYEASPCASNPVMALSRSGQNFLRENMKKELDSAGRCFDFKVQVRNDERAMPIEDPTIEWDEDRAPFVRVARITIPQQDFTSAARDEFCENLSMTPWHSVPELRPLGGINRVRKVVYQQVSKMRHDINRVTRVEPTE